MMMIIGVDHDVYDNIDGDNCYDNDDDGRSIDNSARLYGDGRITLFLNMSMTTRTLFLRELDIIYIYSYIY